MQDSLQLLPSNSTYPIGMRRGQDCTPGPGPEQGPTGPGPAKARITGGKKVIFFFSVRVRVRVGVFVIFSVRVRVRVRIFKILYGFGFFSKPGDNTTLYGYLIDGLQPVLHFTIPARDVLAIVSMLHICTYGVTELYNVCQHYL